MKKTLTTIIATAALALTLGACAPSPADQFKADLELMVKGDEDNMCPIITMAGEDGWGTSSASDGTYPGLTAEDAVQVAKDLCGDDVFDGPTLEDTYQEDTSSDGGFW